MAAFCSAILGTVRFLISDIFFFLPSVSFTLPSATEHLHIWWHWWQGFYAGSLTPLAKYMPTTSPYSSLQKWNRQNCLTFTHYSRTVHFKDSFNSLSPCVWLSTFRAKQDDSFIDTECTSPPIILFCHTSVILEAARHVDPYSPEHQCGY